MKQRIFIAFRLSNQAKEGVQNVQDKLKKENKKVHVRWSKMKGLHVTVVFLGEINAREVEQVKNILLDTANNYHQFTYWLYKLDAFPNKEQARIRTVM